MEPQEVELLTELVQHLTQDVAEVKQLLANQPKPTTLLDARSTLEKVANAVNGLRSEVSDLKQQKPQATSVDLTPISQQLQLLREDVRRSPANRITRGVQYGLILLLVSLVSTGILAYYAIKWKDERDQFEVSDWKWRAVRQDGPTYAAQLDGAFAHDSGSYYQQRVIKLEQADATREAARKASEQAKALSEQANQLEGKAQSKKRKKN
ncbi:hypothetical protein [Spirosoma gilvum]